MSVTPDITEAFDALANGATSRWNPHGAWRSACQDARAAYGFWCEAGAESKTNAYFVYVAALDREEAAALSVAHSVRNPALARVVER